jgi:HTH-type transcriptional regulator/antitoxin HigA
MDTKSIQTAEDLNKALLRIEQLWGAAPNSPEGDELDSLAMRVEKYEDEHFPIPFKAPRVASAFNQTVACTDDVYTSSAHQSRK